MGHVKSAPPAAPPFLSPFDPDRGSSLCGPSKPVGGRSGRGVASPPGPEPGAPRGSEQARTAAAPACQYQNKCDQTEPEPARPYGDRPPEWAPEYVHACHGSRWTVQLRHKTGEASGRRIVYRCRSRHHHGPCRNAWRAQLYARLTDARSLFMVCDPAAAMFLTFTLPPEWHRRRTDKSRLHANRTLGDRLRKWTGWLRTTLKREHREPLRYFWIREDTRLGVPHVHMLAVQPDLASELRDRDEAWAGMRSHGLVTDDEWAQIESRSDHSLAPEHWREAAKRYGWGERFDAQLARSREALTGYAAKIATEIDEREINTELFGEITKGRQAPELLPRHCRSYGYSPGFIPPRDKNSEWTGWLENEFGPVASNAPPIVYGPDGAPLHWHSSWGRLVEHVTEAKKKRAEHSPVFDPHDLEAFWPDSRSAHAAARSTLGGSGVVHVVRRSLRLEQFGQCREDFFPSLGSVETDAVVGHDLLGQNIHVAFNRGAVTCQDEDRERDQIGRHVVDRRRVHGAAGEVSDRVAHEIGVCVDEIHDPFHRSPPSSSRFDFGLIAPHELDETRLPLHRFVEVLRRARDQARGPLHQFGNDAVLLHDETILTRYDGHEAELARGLRVEQAGPLRVREALALAVVQDGSPLKIFAHLRFDGADPISVEVPEHVLRRAGVPLALPMGDTAAVSTPTAASPVQRYACYLRPVVRHHVPELFWNLQQPKIITRIDLIICVIRAHQTRNYHMKTPQL